MLIQERIKKIRKDNNLNQTEFGKKLGVTRNVIKNIELGTLKNGVPDNIIKLISVTFNVNEEWLRTGEGEMFKEEELYSLDEILKQKNVSSLEAEAVKAYFSLDEYTRKKLLSTFKEVFSSEDNRLDVHFAGAENKKIECLNNSTESSNSQNTDELSATEDNRLEDTGLTDDEIPPEAINMPLEEMIQQANKWETLIEKKRVSLASQKENDSLKNAENS